MRRLVVAITLAMALGAFAFFRLTNSPGAAGPTSTGMVSVRIVRDPGLMLVSPLDRTINDSSTAKRLAEDILSLPPFPSGTIYCPVSFGTKYDLKFTSVTGGGWTADLEAIGCQKVTLSVGRNLWAVNSSRLFLDLGTALGIDQYEVMPRPCSSASETHCYQQRSASSL